MFDLAGILRCYRQSRLGDSEEHLLASGIQEYVYDAIFRVCSFDLVMHLECLRFCILLLCH